MNKQITPTLNELSKRVDGHVIGDGRIQVKGITNAARPLPDCIAFATDPRQIAQLDASDLAALIVPPNVPTAMKPVIVARDPKLAWAEILSLFHPLRSYDPGISKHAFVDPSARLGAGVAIEENVHIGRNARIGDGVVVRAQSYIDDDVSIGSQSVIHPNVTLYDRTVVGSRVIIHAGTVIGTDGFGYVFNGKRHVKVNQIGNVVIEDDVEIGGNVCIDRATMGSTVIRAGSKIDNLVQIAHNVSFGPHSVASANTGISGSSKVGAFTILGGGVGIADHAEIGNGVMIGAQAGVPPKKKIPDKSIYIGAPARPIQEMKKQVAAQLRSHEMLTTLKSLKKRVEALERKLADTPTSIGQ